MTPEHHEGEGKSEPATFPRPLSPSPRTEDTIPDTPSHRPAYMLSTHDELPRVRAPRQEGASPLTVPGSSDTPASTYNDKLLFDSFLLLAVVRIVRNSRIRWRASPEYTTNGNLPLFESLTRGRAVKTPKLKQDLCPHAITAFAERA